MQEYCNDLKIILQMSSCKTQLPSYMGVIQLAYWLKTITVVTNISNNTCIKIVLLYLDKLIK